MRDIERMELAPGDKLPPEKVMFQNYQVGRGTLREALRFLELQGILSLKPGPGGGPVVERPDASNLATLLVLLLQFSDARYQTVVEARSGGGIRLASAITPEQKPANVSWSLSSASMPRQ